MCTICGSAAVRGIARSRDLAKAGHIVRCSDCDLTFAHPMPDLDTLTEVYDGLYSGRERFDAIDDAKQSVTRTAMRGYLSRLRELGAEPKAFADVGGGLGYYSEAAQHLGLDVTLVEPDPQSARFARDVLGVRDVHEGLPSDFAAAGGERSFEVVMLRHVIEHVTDPNGLVAEAARLVAPGGVLVLETPNNHAVELFLRPGQLRVFLRYYRQHYADVGPLEVYRRRLFAMRPPIHVHAFTTQNLVDLCQRHGLEVRSSFTYVTGDPTYWPNVGRTAAADILPALRRGRLATAAAALVDTVLYPLRLLAARLGRGSSVCVYAFRPLAD